MCWKFLLWGFKKSDFKKVVTKEKIIKPNLEERLSSEEYYITQNKGTEPAFSGKYNDTKTEGNYNCVCCGETLFTSKEKYDSGTG